MKKFIIGLLVGVGIASSFNVYAAVESLIGHEVQGEVSVKLNGSSLENKAAIVDGSSYLPVRAIGEALGLNVDFQNGEVVLNETKKEEQPKVSEPTAETTQPKLTIDQLNNKIEVAKLNIETTKISIAGKKSDDEFLQTLKDRLAKYEAELTDLEKQKAELQLQK